MKIKIHHPQLMLFSTSIILAVLYSFADHKSKGEEIIETMHSKWKGKWYRNISFEQKAIFYKNNEAVRTEIWQELLSSPGKLHIRFNGFATGNGAIYNNDSVYHYKSGVLQAGKRETNPLELLGFDVYVYTPDITIRKLKEMGFDLSQSYSTTYKKSGVMVIGTSDPSDLNSSQFWVDSKSYLIHRVIQKSGGKVKDVHFNNYQQIKKHWVATEMVFRNGADTVLVEKYFNIRFPNRVQSKTFDPSGFPAARW